ncbi:MAG TPA: hypothetical protein VG708_10935 [Mycobacteriales bacterium]|nr:hypothetical protein [Mycobacteriales bacterium]
MTRDLDQLKETFERHELLAPDPEIVRAKVEQIARSMQRQRWAVRATGGAVLSAGIVAAGLNLPDLIAGSGPTQTVLSSASGSGTSAGTTPTLAEEYQAYFNAGYDYNDAQQLARLWNETGKDIGAVKAEAGGKLLAGQTLPVAPSGTPATPQDLAVQAFFDAGYTYNDAVQLAQLWHTGDAYQAKTKAGKMLESGQTLPIQPSGPKNNAGSVGANGLPIPSNGPTGKTPDAAAADGAVPADVAAFFKAGYTYSDAQRLAQIWHTGDPYQAKVEAARKLRNGEQLPIQP